MNYSPSLLASWFALEHLDLHGTPIGLCVSESFLSACELSVNYIKLRNSRLWTDVGIK